jgi:hypothetical protein
MAHVVGIAITVKVTVLCDVCMKNGFNKRVKSSERLYVQVRHSQHGNICVGSKWHCLLFDMLLTIIMYHNNVANLIHFHYHQHFIVM